MPDPLDIHFIAESRFSCNSCGKCCSSNFEIPLQDTKVSLIKKSSSYKTRAKQGYEPLRVVADSFHFLGYNDKGQCHFLDQSLCALHKHEGISHKPVICQIYPYNLVQTPDGIHVSLLYSCPSVVTGRGAPLEQSRDALQQLFETSQVPVLGPVREHILVTQFSTVTWQQYLVVEQSLWKHIDLEDPVAYLLGAANSLAVPQPWQARFDRRPKSLNKLVSGPFQDFAGSVWAFLKETDDEQAIPMGKPRTDLVRKTINHFLRNQIQGKLLVIGPSMVARLVLLACALNILLYELKARGPTIDAKDLEESFAFIEERLVSQSNEVEPALLEFEEYLLEMNS
jgi:Fe-S-cluster containining protein